MNIGNKEQATYLVCLMREDTVVGRMHGRVSLLDGAIERAQELVNTDGTLTEARVYTVTDTGVRTAVAILKRTESNA